jgi:GNAT superfamily N-acetyltransferase
MDRVEGEFSISDDKTRLSIDWIFDSLSKAYWAAGRSRETVERSIDHSTCFGLYHRRKQIGFARVVTDQATMYWLCDVFIDEAYRGEGLGKKLLKYVVESKALKGLFGILGTRDAHGFYGPFGFKREPETFMRRFP